MSGLIPFTLGIPNAPNNPSADQPIMKINNDAIYTIWARDHVTFNTNDSGTHAKVTYLGKNPPAAPTNEVAITYTNNGLADPTTSQLYYVNSQGTFPLSAIRAFGVFTTVAGVGPTVVALSNGTNVATVTKTSLTTYRVTLLSNTIVNSDNVIVQLSPSSPSRSLGYTFTNPDLDISTDIAAGAGLIINFLILQI